jgi:hypothetical protein
VRSSTLLAYSVITCALLATLAGLASSYGGVVAALLSLGFVLSLGLVLVGGPVRQWALVRKETNPGQGPVSALVFAVEGATRGSSFSQSQIARILRSVRPEVSRQSISKNILEPSGSRPRLKGEEYMVELEAAVKVLRNG